MRTGDTVRLRPGSPLASLLGREAGLCGRVSHTCQIDDDGLRIAIAFEGLGEAHTPLLPAEEFELVVAADTATGDERGAPRSPDRGYVQAM